RRDDGEALAWQRVNAFAHDHYVGMTRERPRYATGEKFAVDGERRPGGNLRGVGLAHDDRAQRAHLAVEQSDRVAVAVVAAEAVRTDHLGERVALMRWRRVAAAAHFGKPHAKPRLGELPCGLGAREAAADDVNVVAH